jgi:hypothetical protein
MAPNQLEIREQAERLLAGTMSLEDFQDWFLPYSWNIHKSGDFDAQQLAYAIDLKLSEFSGEHISEGQFLDALKAILEMPIAQPESTVSVQPDTVEFRIMVPNFQRQSFVVQRQSYVVQADSKFQPMDSGVPDNQNRPSFA